MAASTNTQRAHRYCGLCIARCGCRRRRRPVCPSRTRSRSPTGKALFAKGGAPPKLVDHPKRVTRPLGRTRPTGDPDGANLNLTIDTAVLDPVSGTASYRSYLREIRRSA
jgi:hypothetical protein